MRAIEELRPLTAGALLGLWQAHREAYDDPLERTLRCNAAILQASCHADGEAVYRDEAEVLDDLTPRRWRGCSPFSRRGGSRSGRIRPLTASGLRR